MKDIDLTKLKEVSLEGKKKTKIKIGDVTVGEGFVVMAGPCGVESEEQLLETARVVKECGGDMLRGGAFKPRTSPYSFQGLGLEGLKILEKARDETGLPVVTEVMDPRDVSWVAEYVDVLQIGARNIQNFTLLKEVGKTDKPVLLKRGMYSTLKEWLNCAEYIMSNGNRDVMLCERGIRSFEDYTRNTLDLTVAAALKDLTHLPVIIDTSHAIGRRPLIQSMSVVAAASPADGLMVEVHIRPEEALSDGGQSLYPEQFKEMMKKIRAMEKFVAGSE